MPEYIERSIAKEKHCNWCKECYVCYRGTDCRERRSFDEIPAADVRPVVRGEWIVRGQDIYCSVCNHESGYNPFGASSFSNFCPNCGADMRKGGGTDELYKARAV